MAQLLPDGRARAAPGDLATAQGTGERLTIDWRFTDAGVTYRTTLSNAVLVQDADPPAGDVDLTLTLTRPQLLGVLFARQLDGIDHAGDATAVERLLDLLDRATTDFPIVTP